MPAQPSRAESTAPVLLCFDGSADAAAAITIAGRMLRPRAAVVVTVWERVASWAHSDPATILSAPLSRLVSKELGVDEIIRDVAREQMDRGTQLANEAGFQAEGQLLEGKPWRIICHLAESLGAEPVVLGARGLGRVESVFLGSVSSAVVMHARRPVLVVPHQKRDGPVATPTE